MYVPICDFYRPCTDAYPCFLQVSSQCCHGDVARGQGWCVSSFGEWALHAGEGKDVADLRDDCGMDARGQTRGRTGIGECGRAEDARGVDGLLGLLLVRPCHTPYFGRRVYSDGPMYMETNRL